MVCTMNLCISFLCLCVTLHVNRFLFSVSLHNGWLIQEKKKKNRHVHMFGSLSFTVPSPVLHSTLNKIAISLLHIQTDTHPRTFTLFLFVFFKQECTEWTLIASVMWWVSLQRLESSWNLAPFVCFQTFFFVFEDFSKVILKFVLLFVYVRWGKGVSPAWRWSSWSCLYWWLW